MIVRTRTSRRRDSLLQRRGEHERLEGGARLPLALHREVELAVVVVPPADHREHRAGVRVDRHERRRAGRSAAGSHLFDRLHRELLQLEVDRRHDVQAAAVDLLRAVVRGRAAASRTSRSRAPRRRRPAGCTDSRLRHRRLQCCAVLARVDLRAAGASGAARACAGRAPPPGGAPGRRASGPPGSRRAAPPPAGSSAEPRSCRSSRGGLLRRRTRRCRSRSCSGRR